MTALRTGFIVAYLAVQVGVPLRYYLGEDPFDERFAWRMFSPVRVTDCRVTYKQSIDAVDTRVEPSRDVGPAWVGLMERARLSVIERYAQLRCSRLRSQTAQPALYVELQCTRPDGSAFSPIAGTRNLCGDAP